jgi:hypothetical protein
MWDPQRLTTLWAFTACYRDNFTFYLLRHAYNICLSDTSLSLQFSVHDFLGAFSGLNQSLWNNGFHNNVGWPQTTERFLFLPANTSLHTSLFSTFFTSSLSLSLPFSPLLVQPNLLLSYIFLSSHLLHCLLSILWFFLLVFPSYYL